ncbi:uncharacterized protein CEXT_749331 [Caerostris extrusa]|uniref:Uncharacterized protein n=1 Tax=Caerostris extrusa TaxID=172846 RepID=A0AAV4Y5V4_CAEEX|nr:uncharacterized protein CEXT_749331 [Caerostris extrusa]
MKIFFGSGLFLALLATVFSSDLCPPPELVKPCECVSGYVPVTYRCTHVLHKDSLQEMAENSLDYPMHALMIEESSMPYMSTELVESKKMEIVAIVRSSMISFFDKPPTKNNSLKSFQLRDSRIFARDGLDLGAVRKRISDIIQFQRVNVKRIGDSFVTYVKNTLTQLTLERGDIVRVHSEAFAKLTNLRILSLAYNKIRQIRTSMLPRCRTMYFLDLSVNKISELPEDIFSHLPQLKDVYLRGNQLKVFSSTIFGRILDGMTTINLADNPLVCDCKMKWYTKKRRDPLMSLANVPYRFPFCIGAGVFSTPCLCECFEKFDTETQIANYCEINGICELEPETELGQEINS